MNSLTRAILVVALSPLWAAGCSDSPSAPDVQFLASDTHFMLGGQHIVMPAVAIRGPDHTFDLNPTRPEKSLKQRLKSEASDPGNPMKVDKLGVLVREYRYTGEHTASTGICPLLKRLWSQVLCRGEHRGVLKRLPEKFDLLDRGKLDLLTRIWTVGRERQYDQVKEMAIRPGITEIGCDQESQYCTAMVEVLPNLLAVWMVWGDEKTASTAEQMAHVQGSAIVQFVRRALGPDEDRTLVDAD
jgi:hypothetical protein